MDILNVMTTLEAIGVLMALSQQLVKDKEAGLTHVKVDLLLQYATYLISIVWPDQQGLIGMGQETRDVSRKSMWVATMSLTFGAATRLLKSKLSEDAELLTKITEGFRHASPSLRKETARVLSELLWQTEVPWGLVKDNIQW